MLSAVHGAAHGPQALRRRRHPGVGARAARDRAAAADLAGEADVEIVDLRERPEVAERERIVATPLLVRLEPEPARRILGDLTDVARVRWSLGLPEEGP